MSGTLDCILVMNLLGLELSEITRGVSHCGLAIHIKNYLKAKEESWKLKYFYMQNIIKSKNPLKETKILQDILTL